MTGSFRQTYSSNLLCMYSTHHAGPDMQFKCNGFTRAEERRGPLGGEKPSERGSPLAYSACLAPLPAASAALHQALDRLDRTLDG